MFDVPYNSIIIFYSTNFITESIDCSFKFNVGLKFLLHQGLSERELLRFGVGIQNIIRGTDSDAVKSIYAPQYLITDCSKEAFL